MRRSFFIAFLWALIPLLPAFWTSSIGGSPYTDLYPSVWSLWAVGDWLSNGFKLSILNYPEGQNWYPSALILGLIAQPLYILLSPAWVYNLLLLLSRWLGAISFYLAGYAHTKNEHSSLFFMILVACSPFVHGFSVEGIIEGTQIWPLGFWLWAVGSRKYPLGVLFFFLSILSNWYFGAVACLICLLLGFKDRKIWLSFLGLIPATPFIWLFTSSLSSSAQIPPEIIQMMGFQWKLPTPNILSKPNPFALSTYLGWIPLILLLHRRNRDFLWILPPFFLSLGLPFLYQLPLFSSFRFPYRWHLGTLIILGWVLTFHPWIQKKSWLSFLLLAEYLLLSPIDLFLPKTDALFPSYLEKIDAPLLDIPGPLTRPPGQINPSRPRMKYLLYYQTKHQQPIGWGLDFNGIQDVGNCFEETRLIDPKASQEEKSRDGNSECWRPIQWVLIHNTDQKLNPRLEELGYKKQAGNSTPQLWKKDTHE